MGQVFHGEGAGHQDPFRQVTCREEEAYLPLVLIYPAITDEHVQYHVIKRRDLIGLKLMDQPIRYIWLV